MFAPDPLWYKDAIFYELHVRAFFDANNDGIGDFAGLIQKLDYLQELGITAIWILPFYPSPLRDDGYDISDYHGVHPSYGTRKQFRQFVREAHERGIRVVIELVINHTSDQHPWFQAARNAPKGSTKRNFYVWSDDPKKYSEARVIFTDTETSNWTWDPVAKAYYWHRFFHHQPDLNYDNPLVLRAVNKVMRFWFDMGVDGMRLDAIPYLIEREGTNCENLVESHEIIKRVRSEMDANYSDRMLLAEANQWPADVLAYFGEGDECNMAFHFPLMPRIFMALRQEDRHPIVEIMRQTPEIPPDCQWAIFLRNHDELTLEMVTDDERDYMYREYAADPRMRINLGIRRRLAPLIGNSRPRIELLNSLLFSMPGTPVIYYGDEIGMGDNIYLGDRNGVRTPMQWTGDRNGGFSRADFAALYAPPVVDTVYGYPSINVEGQEREASSLLNWMKRMIALRKSTKAFGRGTIEFLSPVNRTILAYLRRHEGEIILCVANLSRFVQPLELDLSEFRGLTPVEMIGRVPFPTIGEASYSLSLGPTAFMWFRLELAPDVQVRPVEPAPSEAPSDDLPTVKLPGGWSTVMDGPVRAVLERTVLPRYLVAQRWFGSKSKQLETVSLRDWVALVNDPEPAYMARIRAYTNDGQHDTYLMPMAVASGEAAEAIQRDHPGAVMARLRHRSSEGLLYDATVNDAFCLRLLELTAGTNLKTQSGRLHGAPTRAYKELRGEAKADALTIRRGSVEQSNTTLIYGDRLLMKVFRRLETGENPDVEIGRFLTEKTEFNRVPRMAGSLEYRRLRGDTMTISILQELVPNQGQGWEWVLSSLGRYYEHVESETHRLDRIEGKSRRLMELSDTKIPDDVFEVVGAALRSAEVLGQRTGEMHLALASDPTDPAFAPEPLTAEDLVHRSRKVVQLGRQVLDLLRAKRDSLDVGLSSTVDGVLHALPELLDKAGEINIGDESIVKIRCHGDYHLGQVLWQQNDFIILDFEGEPGRPIAERRAKQSPLKDVAGMLRSFDYAASSALFTAVSAGMHSIARLEPWAAIWRTWTSASFLKAYRETVADASFVPKGMDPACDLLELFVLEKLLFEMRYELNYRPGWVRIPLLALMRLARPAGYVLLDEAGHRG